MNNCFYVTGRDDVRMARKKAIKTIQDTISILENKVPQPQEESMVVDQSCDDNVSAPEDKTPETEKEEINNGAE